jgi:hypothetical protein
MSRPPSLSTATSEAPSPDEVQEAWCLSLVRHPEPGFLGRRLVMTRPGLLELGRHAEALGPDALRDEQVSRRHARLSLDDQGDLSLEDLLSRNGTFLNGLRVEQARLAPGDVVGLGPFLLLVHRAPASHVPSGKLPGSPALDGVSHLLEALLDRARSLAQAPGPLVIEGEPGSGKERLARAIHDLGRPGQKWVVIDPGALQGDLLIPELFGHEPGAFPGAMEGREGLLAAAHGGTLLLDGLELVSPAFQAALLRFLEGGEVRALGASSPRRVEARVIALSRRPVASLVEDGTLSRAFALRFSGERLRVPPLRERREDIPLVLRALLAERGQEAAVDASLMLALLRSDLPGNTRQLRSVIQQAAREGGEVLRLDATLARELGVSFRSVTIPPRGEGRTTMDRGGAWFVLPDGRRCELSRRPSLQRILACILQAGGEPVDTSKLLEAGWPGERIQASAGQSRVYVAISTLRRLGLREAIEHDERGYRISSSVEVDGGNRAP